MALATADIHIKIDPQVKKDSEAVLEEIGISMSDLFNITLRKLVRDRRIPFDVTANKTLPQNLSITTKEQLIDFLNQRDQLPNENNYTSQQMQDLLSAKLSHNA